MPREPMTPDEKFEKIAKNVESTLEKHLDKLRQKVRRIDFNQARLETDQEYWNEIRDRIDQVKEESATVRRNLKNCYDRYSGILCKQLLRIEYPSPKSSLLKGIKDGSLLKFFTDARKEDSYVFRDFKKKPTFDTCFQYLGVLFRANYSLKLLNRTEGSPRYEEDVLEMALEKRVESAVKTLMEDLLVTVETRSALDSVNDRDDESVVIVEEDPEDESIVILEEERPLFAVEVDEELEVETVRSGEEVLVADSVVETDIVEAVETLEERLVAARIEVEVQQEENHSSEGHDNLENIDEDLVKVEKIAEKLKKDYEEVKEFNKKPEDYQLFRGSVDQFAKDTDSALNIIWVLKDLIGKNMTMEQTRKSDSLHRLDTVRDQLRNAMNNAHQQLQKSQSRLMDMGGQHLQKKKEPSRQQQKSPRRTN